MSGNSTAVPAVDPQSRGTVAKIANRMKRSMAREELSDVAFTVGRDHDEPRIFRAHKYILSVSSDVFNAMFNGGLAENGADPIETPDVFPEAFANMLSFVYTDAMDGLKLDNVYQTLYCGERYDITQLVEACCTFLASKLNGTNWLTYYEKAKLWGAEKAMQACLEFVDRSSELVFLSVHFENIPHETLMMILQRDTLTTDENTIYLAVERWAAAACARANMERSPENRRQTLGAALYLIRFPLLRDAQLLDGPAKTGLLQQDELWDICQYKHATVKPPLSFPTAPRQCVMHQIGAFCFKDREEIFVRNRQFWFPAHVTGISAPNVAYVSTCSGKSGVVAPEKLIRAADYLKRGQRVWVGRGCCALPTVYGSLRRPGVHTVRLAGKERGKPFADLSLCDWDLDAWKAANRAAL
ncbi:BTB/POZ domain-containing protein 3-like [Paramacrobiotus metropolitanus]|uniref:BTB/POZ domain-containing protein 3-like n=1 Tax=Paramacrobiotus metropolitanus TaxID=2943436 RepID=UPI00244618FC|nr:BTB/POZ domain-containing protein 3-like [Paramacrobiotus metropolitanus]